MPKLTLFVEFKNRSLFWRLNNKPSGNTKPYGQRRNIKNLYLVKKPGEWNRFTITSEGKMIAVTFNGEVMNMDLWTCSGIEEMVQ